MTSVGQTHAWLAGGGERIEPSLPLPLNAAAYDWQAEEHSDSSLVHTGSWPEPHLHAAGYCGGQRCTCLGQAHRPPSVR